MTMGKVERYIRHYSQMQEATKCIVRGCHWRASYTTQTTWVELIRSRGYEVKRLRTRHVCRIHVRSFAKRFKLEVPK